MSIFLHGKYLPNNSVNINTFCGSCVFKKTCRNAADIVGMATANCTVHRSCVLIFRLKL